MKVLVTGANGFLGQRVVAALLSAGHEVAAAVRSPARAHGLGQHDRLELRQADLRVDPLDDLLAGVDVVIHLAAQVTGSDEARFASTVVGTERLLAAVPGSAVTRFVLISSYSVYDWEKAPAVLDETAPVMSSPYTRDGYTVAKVWQEKVVREFASSHDVDVTILRPGFIWGPGKEDLAGAGVRIGPVLLVVGPRMRLPLTFVTNCADAVVAAVREPAAAGETFNLVDGTGVSAWRYAGFLARLDASVRTRVPVPYGIGRALVAVLAVVMPRLYRAGGKLPGVLVPASFAARFRPVTHTSSKARRVLGWSPRVDFKTAERQSLSTASDAG